MIEEKRLDQNLNEIDRVIVPSNMSQFVQKDGIEQFGAIIKAAGIQPE